MEFVYTEIKKHPLRDCWMLFIPLLPFIPPFFGTKQECEDARMHAEKNAEHFLADD